MDADGRGPRVDAFIAGMDRFAVGVKWMLALLGTVAVLSFIVILGAIADARKQTVDTIHSLERQVEVLRDQNAWSVEDRRDLHETQGALREALKRLEVRKP